MALALNRVDFLKSFEDVVVEEVFKILEIEDLEFLFWYRAMCCQERTGYLGEFIKEKKSFLNNDYYEFNMFCELANVERKGINLKSIEDIMNEFCKDMAKGKDDFSKVCLFNTKKDQIFNINIKLIKI